MDEWKAVPVEPTREMIRAGAECLRPSTTYKAMLAAAPTTHVAVKRELLEELELWARHKLGGPVIECIADKEAVRQWRELRALLSQKGE